jgi:hypothetical protein
LEISPVMVTFCGKTNAPVAASNVRPVFVFRALPVAAVTKRGKQVVSLASLAATIGAVIVTDPKFIVPLAG